MIIDAHTHVNIPRFNAKEVLAAYLEPLKALEQWIPKGDDEDVLWAGSRPTHELLLETMDASGVDVSVALPIDWGLVGTVDGTVEEFIDWLFEGCTTTDRIVPFMCVDPLRRDALDIVRRVFAKWSPVGIKVYPSTGWDASDPSLVPFWDLIEDTGMKVVSHAGSAWGPLDDDIAHPSHFRPVAESHPDTDFVIAHMGGKYMDEMWPLLDDLDNVYTDVSALQGWLPSRPDMVMERLSTIARRAPERTLFGTDWSLFELNYPNQMFVPLVRDSEWASEDVKSRIMGGNARRLLGI